MKNWDYHGPVFTTEDISWANDQISAWAGQVMERHGRYYLYYCTWDSTSKGKQSIGVAVADKPTGPFKELFNQPVFDPGYPIIDANILFDDASGLKQTTKSLSIATLPGVTENCMSVS